MNCRIILVFVCSLFIHDCEELKIENANVCYSYKYKDGSWWNRGKHYWWIAEITCHDGYEKRTNVKNPRCQVHLSSAEWSDSAYQYKCVPEKSVDADRKTENNLARDVALAILIIMLLGVVLFVIMRELGYRRKSRCLSKNIICFKANIEQSYRDKSSQTIDISVVCSPDVNRESEYHCIADHLVDFDLRIAASIYNENCEYSVIDDHLNTRHKDDLPSQASIYPHATNNDIDINAEMDTYSHINQTQVPNNFSRLRYDAIAIDDDSNASDMGKHEASVYNHTNARRIVPVCAVSVHDTYSHVDNDFVVTDTGDTD